MKTTFYVYKIGNTYLKISTNKKPTGGMFITTLVKDINKANYWTNKRDAESWMVDKKYPNAKLVPCGLCEKA
jgi:hypothetical protein